jgi:hypothetical protein
MTKFLEFQIDGKYYFINLDHIAIIKQIDLSETEITLLSPLDDKNGKVIRFGIPTYGELRSQLQEMGKVVNKIAIVTKLEQKS